MSSEFYACSEWVATDAFYADRPHRTCGDKVKGFITSAVCNLIFSIVVVFLLRLAIFRPYTVRPHVDAAALAAFDLVPGSNNATAPATAALRYDLALNVTFLNDRRVYGIRFDHLTAGLYYAGVKLGPSDAPLPSFKLHPRRRRTVYPVLRGRAGVGGAVAEALEADTARRRIDVDVRVKTTLTYRFWPYRATYYHEYDCWLRFAPPPPGNGTAAVTGGVECELAK